MHKIAIFIFLAVLLALFLFNTSETAYATYNYEKNDYDYRNYWLNNKNVINEKFNDYINGFHESCIDHTGLRNLLQPSEKIRNLSLELVNSEDELKILYILHSFVNKEIEYKEIDENINPEQILELKQGDCSEKSILLYSLLESKGMKAYISDGNNHRYIWAKIDNIWLPVDATSDDLFYAYKNWNSRYQSQQQFLLNSTNTLFNNSWCI